MALTRSERKSAKVATRSVERLLKKYGRRIGAEGAQAVESALDNVRTAQASGDGVSLVHSLNALEAAVEQHLGQYRKSPTREYIESIAWAVGIAMLLRTFVIEAFTIPSGSMIPTLAVGDFLFVNKLAYGFRMPVVNEFAAQWNTPARGDVVVFVYPCNERQDYIKRVVALPGDVVESDALGFVRINGEVQPEKLQGPFEQLKTFTGGDYGSNSCPSSLAAYDATLDEQSFVSLHCGGMAGGHWSTQMGSAFDWAALGRYQICDGLGVGHVQLPPMPWKVPEGYVFVMGDNRGNSADSRFWGFVPVGHVKGRAMFIWMSWDSSMPWAEPQKLVRWDRMFEMVHGNFGRTD